VRQAFNWTGSVVDVSMPDHFRRGIAADNLPVEESVWLEEAIEAGPTAVLLERAEVCSDDTRGVGAGLPDAALRCCFLAGPPVEDIAGGPRLVSFPAALVFLVRKIGGGKENASSAE